MNWLAHLLLSESTPSFRVGNLLPDFLNPDELRRLPPHFAPGTHRHLLIDAFTDSHQAVRRSIARIESPYRRYGGILVDIFYDHFLANDWGQYSAVPLENFAQEAYASFETCRNDLPASVLEPFERMAAENWLCSYRDVAGITDVLNRVGRRLRKPFELGRSIYVLEKERKNLHQDFKVFFPELMAHVASDGQRDYSTR